MTDFSYWTSLNRDTLIPKGVYDFKVDDEGGNFVTELRMTLDRDRYAVGVDEDLSKSFDKPVFVISAQAVPFGEPSVTMSVADYDFLIGHATIGVTRLRSRANRTLAHQRLFQIVANSRRSN
jgi:hypothetical protein